jgi:hypothetical protein
MNAPTSAGGTARRSRGFCAGLSRGSLGFTRKPRAGLAPSSSSSTASLSIAEKLENAPSIVLFASPRVSSAASTSRSIARFRSVSGKSPFRGRYGSTYDEIRSTFEPVVRG